MGLEAVYFLGALVLLTALICGTLSYRYRNRAATQAGHTVNARADSFARHHRHTYVHTHSPHLA